MSLPELRGYKGLSLEVLRRHSVSVGDFITVKTDKAVYQGSLMPRYEYADDQHIVIKLKNGYNIGVRVRDIRSIVKLAKSTPPSFQPPPPPAVDKTLPKVAIIGTGGTIASRVDYRTGGVHPQFTAEELYTAVPEIAEYAQIHTEPLLNIFSENMSPDHWVKVAEKAAEDIREGFEGVVIAHGTDTMGYTAAALSFALEGSPVPIVLVGSQRSSDRPSSDAALNLIGAVVTAAKAGFSGVYVAMHDGISDDAVALHLGTRVRKNHTSRRDAFESIDTPPAAYVKDGEVEAVLRGLPARGESRVFEARCRFERRVALLKFHPGFDPGLINYLIDSGYRGIVFEGTGLGHLSEDCFKPVGRAVKSGLLVCMTSQCIWGRVRMTVYDTGRDLLRIGVLPLEDMIPETALVKAMWALGNAESLEEAKKLMLQNIAGEYLGRSPVERRPQH